MHGGLVTARLVTQGDRPITSNYLHTRLPPAMVSRAGMSKSENRGRGECVVPFEHVELASLNVPDNPQTRARLAELTHPGGTALQPAETYETRDPAGLVTITVNKDQMVTNVRIRPRWFEQLRPEAFPATIYNTYVTAVQRALAVEFAHRPAHQQRPSTPNTTRSAVRNRRHNSLTSQRSAALSDTW